jgi:pimeloyl-ACP methyl ester carboxylesterase
MALLELGWPIIYCRLSDMSGCPEAIGLMHRFHEDIVRLYRFASKPVLFGFSRGGTYALNYAARYPDDVAALYLDAPVLDLLSWPGGKGEGDGAPA